MEVEGLRVDGTSEGALDGRVEGDRDGMEVEGLKVDGRSEEALDGLVQGARPNKL